MQLKQEQMLYIACKKTQCTETSTQREQIQIQKEATHLYWEKKPLIRCECFRQIDDIHNI